jgi:hypothetical protein
MANELYTLQRQFDKAIVPTLRETPSGMSLLPLNTDYRGLGKAAVRIMGYAARGGAKIGLEIMKTAGDGVDITGFDTKIAVIQDDAVIKRTDWEAYVENGIPISNDIALEMTGNIQKAVDDIIFQGWAADGTTYDIKGLYQVAGTATTGAVTSVFGNTLISVNTAIADLETAGIYTPGYILALNPANYAEAASQINSGVVEMSEVLKALGQGGRAVKNSRVTANYGMVFPAPLETSRKFFDIVETVPPFHDVYFIDNSKTSDIGVRQVTRLGVRFKHQSSAGTGTDIAVSKISGL